MIISTIKEFKVQYDETLKLVRVEWAAGGDMRRFRSSLEQLHHVVEQLPISLAILDLCDLPDISAYDQIWIGTHWMPRIWVLPLQQVSIVIPVSRVYNQQAVEMLLHMARPFIKFDIQFFRHAATALSWSLEHEPRLPTLLAEWEAANGPSASDASVVAEPYATYGPQ